MFLILTYLVVATFSAPQSVQPSIQTATNPQTTLGVQGSPVCVQACNEPSIQ